MLSPPQLHSVGGNKKYAHSEKHCKILFRLHCYSLCLQIRLPKITVSILSFISMNDSGSEVLSCSCGGERMWLSVSVLGPKPCVTGLRQSVLYKNDDKNQSLLFTEHLVNYLLE